MRVRAVAQLDLAYLQGLERGLSRGLPQPCLVRFKWFTLLDGRGG
ncbi:MULTISPECIES: hypothetical protein [unclassified Synechococcus]|nr:MULTISPECIES: hypothetical protein [unclassified Synechococcus]WFN58365.1 hypothetical protein N4320_11180 [Synechococcus sp. CCFWC 502]